MASDERGRLSGRKWGGEHIGALRPKLRCSGNSDLLALLVLYVPPLDFQA